MYFFRHRHSFIGNNLEKLPRSENNLTRYQTSLALDQVEHGTVESDNSSFNIKYAESRGITTESDLSEKNRENKKDNYEKNIQLEAATVRCFFRLSAIKIFYIGFYFNYILNCDISFFLGDGKHK